MYGASFGTEHLAQQEPEKAPSSSWVRVYDGLGEEEPHLPDMAWYLAVPSPTSSGFPLQATRRVARIAKMTPESGSCSAKGTGHWQEI